jgi:hypothetical protein
MRFEGRMPIYGILYTGYRFQFFIFDGSTKPYKFRKGVVAGNRAQTLEGLPLLDFSSKPTADFFLLQLCPICETIFNFFLVTYITTLKAFRDVCAQHGQHGRMGNLAHWDEAINLAEAALGKSQDAEAQRQDNLIDAADATAQTVFGALKLRYAFVSDFNFPHRLTYEQYRCCTNDFTFQSPTSNGQLG